MSITRRNLLKLAGGSLLGALFTPIPYKLLDDSSIWTQNWSLTPTLPRGPITFKYSACTLCPGGCALKARCVNGHPVSLSGVIHHPISRGILCPIGLAGHHLSYHPLRLSQSCKFPGKNKNSKLVPTSTDDIVAEIAKTLKDMQSGRTDGAIAVLDQRTGRSISNVYQGFLTKFPKSYYVLPPSREDSTLATVQMLSREKLGPLGFDFENTKTVLSFGTPLLDGWGTPGRMTSLFNNRKQSGLKLIQVESVQSHTALQADKWLPVRPGTEAVLALGIANVIVHEGLYRAVAEKHLSDFAEYKTLVADFTPRIVCDITGINLNTIVDTARAITGSPSIVLSGCNPAGGPFDKETEIAIAGLNLLIGNIGKQGGIVVRNETPGTTTSTVQPTLLADVPDHSLRILIVDPAESGYTFPSSLMQKKVIADGGIVVHLSPYLSAQSAQADYLIPAPAHLESLEEVATPGGASSASFGLSSPLMLKSEKTVEPIEFVKKLADAVGISSLNISTTEALLKERVQAIYASKRGMIFSSIDGTTSNVSDVKNADELWSALTNGVWIDNPAKQILQVKFSMLGNIPASTFEALAQSQPNLSNALVLMPFGWRGATSTGMMSPIMSKLFQESDMRSLAGRVFVNPKTAASQGLADGESATLHTEKGMMDVIVKMDATVMPGVVHAAIGPSPNKSETQDHFNGEGALALCVVQQNGTWRLTDATLKNVKA